MFAPDGVFATDRLYSAALFVEHVAPRTFLSCKMCKTIKLRREGKETPPHPLSPSIMKEQI